DFTITDKGIVGGKTLYTFDDIHSFWIHEEPPLEGVLSLHSNSIMSPFIHVPIGGVPAEELRDILINFIPEEKHEPTVIDTLEKMLHI
ncbi:MAG: hypothetical protein WAT81_04860, partial [Candidatus Moraniibacteriota bacterium]